MKRRDFIALLGGAVSAWPLAARGQQPAMPVIGFVGTSSSDLFAERLRAFREGLGETGYVEGRNVSIEYRWAENQNDRLPALVGDLVRRRAAVITANSATVALVAKAATTTIPIIFGIGGDPVADGLVASLNRPGGNVTGVSFMAQELGPKLLELLHEVVPAATDIALLVNPSNPTYAQAKTRQAAVGTLGLQLHLLHASTESDLDAVFATVAKLRAGGLVIAPDPSFASWINQLATMSLSHAIPAITYGPAFLRPVV
jgi:putative ABC transport system substrate-binding protein